MTIIKQEVERTVRGLVSIAECDQCKVHVQAAEHGSWIDHPNGWVIVRVSDEDLGKPPASFCSWSCVYVYAHIQAGRAKAA